MQVSFCRFDKVDNLLIVAVLVIRSTQPSLHVQMSLSDTACNEVRPYLRVTHIRGLTALRPIQKPQASVPGSGERWPASLSSMGTPLRFLWICSIGPEPLTMSNGSSGIIGQALQLYALLNCFINCRIGWLPAHKYRTQKGKNPSLHPCFIRSIGGCLTMSL